MLLYPNSSWTSLNQFSKAVNSLLSWYIYCAFRPVIFADGQYAIFDDMSEFKVQTDETGLDLEHMKLALKTLAKLHAMSFAYFNNANVDIKGVSYLETSIYQNWVADIVSLKNFGR